MVEATERDGVDCHASWCRGEEWCAVTCAMEAIGNKWHPVIVDRLLAREPRRFNELQRAAGDVTNKVLSESLEDLAEQGIVDRTVVAEKPVAVEYELTDRGRALAPVIEALREWGRTHIMATDTAGSTA